MYGKIKRLGNISKIFNQNVLFSPSNNFPFISTKFRVFKLLDEIGFRGHKVVNKLKEELTDDNITLSSKFNLQIQNDFKHCP